MDGSPPTERGFTGSLMSVPLRGAWQKLSSAVAECWLRIVYANPVHDQAMGKHGWLSRRAEWPATDFPGFGYPVSFWETIGPVDSATGYSLFPGPLAPGPAPR